MDATTIATLASAAVSLLAPYLKSVGEVLAKKAGEEVGKRAGGAAWDKAKQLYETVKAKFATKPSAAESLDKLAKSPENSDVQSSVKTQLENTMSSDESFARELANILKQAADAGVDTMFHTTIQGDIQKLVQIGVVYGNIEL